MALIHPGVRSEYARLASVLLYRPGPEIDSYPNPAEIQHLHPIDHAALACEFDGIIETFESLGVQVLQIDPTPLDDDRWYRYNMMYCRDLFFMTPAGAVMASMAHATRRDEVRYAERTLTCHGVPVLQTVSGEGRFEGADALWINEGLVAVGVGNRTNHEGYEQVRDLLRTQGVECVALPSHQTQTQHLLGSVQLVDRDLALVRHGIADAAVTRFLRECGYTVVDIPENGEVRERQAMNIVTVAPRTVVMTAGCPATRELYRQAGLTVAAEREISQLMHGAGGLACATGVVARG